MKKLVSLALVLMMVLWALPVMAEGPYQVGICQLAPHPALDAATNGFMDVLKEELGEENVVFDLQNAAGEANTCAQIVNTFVNNEVDLIMANATAALQASYAGTSDIPVLGTSITEYGVALDVELVNGCVGGNVSGTSDLAPLDQQADMILTLFPEAKKIGIIYCSAEPNSIYQVETVKAYLEGKGLEATLYPFADSNDAAAVTQTACDNSDVIYVPTDNVVAANTGIIDNICQPAGIPVIAGEAGICSGCGVATLSIDYYELGRVTGMMAVKVLKGEANISEMPIEYYPNPVAMYNPVICGALGVTVPADYVALDVE